MLSFWPQMYLWKLCPDECIIIVWTLEWIVLKIINLKSKVSFRSQSRLWWNLKVPPSMDFLSYLVPVQTADDIRHSVLKDRLFLSTDHTAGKRREIGGSQVKFGRRNLHFSQRYGPLREDKDVQTIGYHQNKGLLWLSNNQVSVPLSAHLLAFCVSLCKLCSV